MEREQAMRILMEQEGWNFYGADAIVETIAEQIGLENLTEEELIRISEDHKGR